MKYRLKMVFILSLKFVEVSDMRDSSCLWLGYEMISIFDKRVIISIKILFLFSDFIFKGIIVMFIILMFLF